MPLQTNSLDETNEKHVNGMDKLLKNPQQQQLQQNGNAKSEMAEQSEKPTAEVVVPLDGNFEFFMFTYAITIY